MAKLSTKSMMKSTSQSKLSNHQLGALLKEGFRQKLAVQALKGLIRGALEHHSLTEPMKRCLKIQRALDILNHLCLQREIYKKEL